MLPFNQRNRIYAFVVFSKYPETYYFKRNFTKIDTIFSYVGGLMASLLPLFFFIRFYSRASYLVALAERVFNLNHHNRLIQSKDFSFL